MGLENDMQKLRDENSPFCDLCNEMLLDPFFPSEEGDAAILKYLIAFKKRFTVLAYLVDQLILKN